MVVARFALALSIGLLVGLERGWRERDSPAGSRTGGIRTFGITGLLGGIMAALADATGSSLLLACGFMSFAAVFGLFKLREAWDDEDYSVTSVIAALCVFGLGALAVDGDPVAAAAGGTALAATLASRDILHAFLRRLTWIELRSALMLAVMTAVILPLLPNRDIGRALTVNPFEVWLFTVLTATISFAGYITVRLFGERRGTLIGAAAGALVSSTAVTLTLARSAKDGAEVRRLAGAACLAATVSILRVAGLTLIVGPAVLPKIAPVATVAAVVFACMAVFLTRAAHKRDAVDVSARNPFEVRSLFLFATIYVLALSASKVLVAYLGDSAVLLASIISGSFDVDVAVLTALRRTDLQASDIVVHAVLGAMAANAIGRVILAASAGPARFTMLYAATTTMAIAFSFMVFIWNSQ
ncbi:hypothetical protein B5K11_30020 [Rhizobium leguminosarum bv. trifolii]|nr:hypothetical protein B5K11_30020 [Rhizobium leguminosarum bv. trifolii]